MNREGKKCVLYPRVSTEMQVDGYSLEGQKNGLKRFADREEMEIVGIYEDAGKSGKSIEGRPAFKKMLSDIGNGLEIDYILVYKLSRFGRNAADILNSLEYVQSYGVNLICIEEGIDSSQTSGKLLISVLSAVAEIERENIIEQTMNGRREKARQGGWNGGFAPYGYYLKDNQLLIEESEAAAIRIIFEKFAGSDIGYGGIAKYLNLQGIKKIPRQNGTLENWSGHLVRQILDNPVYCGKIAYGRRTREKVKGTKNEYKQVHAEDYILEDGQHEGIVSEELWQKVHAKRVATGIKQPSKTGKDRSHLLTGVLKCPLCGSPMYTNKHAWTNKDGTYKEVYYYICGRNKQERGHYCEYKASLRKTDIEPLVIEAIRELVSDKSFAKEIKKRFGVQTDTSKIDKELANYESKLKEVDLNKARLEREIDNLPADAKYRERKIHDMTIRLDGLYDTIVELEERIEDAKLRRSSIEMEAITLENVYRIMENFSKLYAIISDEEKKSLVSYLIKEIQIYPNGTSDRILKSIEFNFPIYRDGREIRKLLWENGNTVETVTGGNDTINVNGMADGLPQIDVLAGAIGAAVESDMAMRAVGHETCAVAFLSRHGIKVHKGLLILVSNCVGDVDFAGAERHGIGSLIGQRLEGNTLGILGGNPVTNGIVSLPIILTGYNNGLCSGNKALDHISAGAAGLIRSHSVAGCLVSSLGNDVDIGQHLLVNVLTHIGEHQSDVVIIDLLNRSQSRHDVVEEAAFPRLFKGIKDIISRDMVAVAIGNVVENFNLIDALTGVGQLFSDKRNHLIGLIVHGHQRLIDAVGQHFAGKAVGKGRQGSNASRNIYQLRLIGLAGSTCIFLCAIIGTGAAAAGQKQPHQKCTGQQDACQSL